MGPKTSRESELREHTYASCFRIDAVFNEFLDYGTEIDNDLARLNLMDLNLEVSCVLSYGVRAAMFTVRPSICLMVAMVQVVHGSRKR